jgi:small subunit ribosomal protein S13
MPRVCGVGIPNDKKIEYSLQYIYGIGPSKAREILQATQIDPNRRAKDLNEQEVSQLASTIQGQHKTEGDLRRDISMSIKRLVDIQSYRGIRHRKGLPVRGQRTHTNGRTRKGPKKLVTAKAAKK